MSNFYLEKAHRFGSCNQRLGLAWAIMQKLNKIRKYLLHKYNFYLEKAHRFGSCHPWPLPYFYQESLDSVLGLMQKLNKMQKYLLKKSSLACNR